MPSSRQLLENLIKIEMNNLKNICPFVYEIKCKSNMVISDENNKSVNIRNRETKYIPINKITATYCSKNVSTNDVSNNLCLYKIYFINGYNEYVSLSSQIQSNYNVTCDEKCNLSR
jgi:hypothetical protein